MKNPFEYGAIVEADAFCNRQRELADLNRAIENGERIFLFGERRMGKTSLVKRAMSKLAKNRFIAAYVDLWPTDSEESFISAFASALTEAANNTPQKMLEFARSFFSRLVPSVTLDAEGKARIDFTMAGVREVERTLEDVLSAPMKISKKTNKQILIVLDELQQLFEYEDDLVERQLRSSMQQQRGVSYIMLGSRKHLIQKMLLDKARPLFRAGAHYPLEPISEEHWLEFIQDRFVQTGKFITSSQISEICTLTQGHPFYTQHLCHALWELTDEKAHVADEAIGQSLDMVLAREDYAYNAIWESLTLSQRRLLEGLALDPPQPKIFAAEFLDRYELKSASTAQRAVKGLIERDIIDREKDSYQIVDRFFQIWIRRKHE
ncbi:MAG TPA: ATP-binding protein [Candidatus Obscuribacterales bacterium]